MLALFVGWIIYFCLRPLPFQRRAQPEGRLRGGPEATLPKYIELAVVGRRSRVAARHRRAAVGQGVDNSPGPRSHRHPDCRAAIRLERPLSRAGRKVRHAGHEIGHPATILSAWIPTDPAGKDDILVLNEIHVAVNKPVSIYLSSKDVIHSLKIMAMRVTQDAIPGLRIPLHGSRRPRMAGTRSMRPALRQRPRQHGRRLI